MECGNTSGSLLLPLPSKTNSSHFSSRNISAKQHCPLSFTALFFSDAWLLNAGLNVWILLVGTACDHCHCPFPLVCLNVGVVGVSILHSAPSSIFNVRGWRFTTIS